MRWMRAVPLTVLLYLLQVGVFPSLRLFGVVPDVVLLVAISLAWAEGPEVGAWFGFVGGLAVDLVSATPLGVIALSYAVVAYLVGTVHHAVDRQVPLMSAMLGLVGGLVAGLVFTVAAILTGADHLQQVHTIKVIVAVSIYDAILALPVSGLVQFAIRDQRPRRIS